MAKLNDAKKNHYEKLIPAIKKAREVLSEALESEDERIRIKTAKFILKNADDWLSATGTDPITDGIASETVSEEVLNEIE